MQERMMWETSCRMRSACEGPAQLCLSFWRIYHLPPPWTTSHTPAPTAWSSSRWASDYLQVLVKTSCQHSECIGVFPKGQIAQEDRTCSQRFLNGFGCLWMTSQEALVVKNPPANAGDIRDVGLIPGLGRSSRGGHDKPLQYWRIPWTGAWRIMVQKVAESNMTKVTSYNVCIMLWTSICIFSLFFPPRQAGGRFGIWLPRGRNVSGLKAKYPLRFLPLFWKPKQVKDGFVGGGKVAWEAQERQREFSLD